MANKIGIVLALDGEKEFSQGLKTASSAAKEAESELKKLDSQYSGSANSMEALKAKQEALANAQEKYTQKVSAAQSGLDHANTTLEKSKTRYSELQKEVDNARKALQDMESAGKSGTSAYTEQADKVQRLETALRDQGTECDKAQQKVYQYQTKLNGAESELNGMNQAVEQNEQYMREAESSVDGCATSIDQYGNQVQQAETVTTSWSDKLKQAFANAAVTVGMRALREGIREIVKAFKEMVEVGSEFEASMSNVSALSGATGSDLDSLSTKAQELGSSTKFTATEVADAFSYMALAGWDTQQMLDGISGVLDLAAASGMELADASDLVTDYLTAFSMEASEASTVADMLSYAQANSNTTTEQLGEAYKNCAANMNAAGQDIQTVTACLEAMANQGYKGAQAGTALKAVMRDITNNMQDGAIAIGDTTVAVQDQDGNFRDLTDILYDVEAATDGMGTAEKQTALSTTFTSRSLSALNLMLNEGVDNISDYEDALRNCDGAAADMADTMQDNLQGDITRMNSALQGLGIAIYDYINEPLRNAVEGVTNILSGITNAITPQQTVVQQQASSVKEIVQDVKSANDDLNSVMESSQAAIDDAVSSSERITLLGAQLESLNGIEDKTVTQKDRMKEIVDELSQSIPELAAAFDDESGKVLLTNDAIEKLVQSSADLEKVNIWTDTLADEYKALADAELAYARASDQSEKLQGEADLWSEVSQACQDYQMSLDVGIMSEEEAAQAAEDLASIQEMLKEAFLNGVISEEEYQGALDKIGEASSEAGTSFFEAASGLGEYANSLANEYVPGAEEAAQETEELKQSLDEASDQYKADEQTLEDLAQAQEEEAQSAETAATQSQVVVNMMDELDESGENAAEQVGVLADASDGLNGTMKMLTGALTGNVDAGAALLQSTNDLSDAQEDAANSANLYYDSEGNLIGTLEELEESTIDAADAETEIYDESQNCIGTMGDFAASIDETAEAMTTLTETAEDAAVALATSYTDAFNSVMDLYNSTKESLANGLDIDFRTEFNGGADESVESMIETAQANIEALQDYANNLEIVKEHVGQEIAPEFLEYLEGLGTDGANTLQHIADTFEQDNGSELIKQWSDQYLETLDIEDQIAATLALDQLMLQDGLSDLGSTDAEWEALQSSFDEALQIAENSGQQISEAERNAFNEAVLAAQEAGVEIPDGLAEGLENGTVSIESATDQLNASMQGKFNALQQIAEEQGIEIPDGLAEGVAQGGDAAADAINTLIDAMTESLASGSGDISDAADSAVEEGVDGAGEGAGDGIGADIDESIADDVEANAGVITEATQSATEQAATGVEQGSEAITEAANSAIDQTLEAVSDKEDEFVSAGEKIGEGIAEGLENSADSMTSAVESALNEVAGAADTIDLSGFEAVGERAGQEFGNGIMASDISGAVSEMANGALEAIGQTAESFTSRGTESGQNYSTGISGAAGQASSAARVLSTGALDTLSVTEANYTTKGTESGENYSTGISSQQGAASSAGNTIAQAAISALATASGSFTTQGITSGSNFANGISSQAGAASSAASSCASAAVGAVQGFYGSFYSAGSSMASGLAAGISGGGSAAISAAVSVATSALNAAKSALSISSPSKKFEDEVGLMSSKGLANGILDGMSDVQNASVDLAEASLEAMENDLEIASPSKKFRKRVGRNIGKGVAFGIKDASKEAEDEAAKSSQQIYDKAVKWLDKYEKKHKTSRKQAVKNEKWYWNQVIKYCKEGTDGYNKAAAKLAVATVGRKKDYDTIADYYSAIYNAADDYLSKRETLNEWSLSEELSYWESIQRVLKKGTDAWYDAQEQINKLASQQGAIDDDALSRAKDTLSHIQTMNDTSAEQEVKYWESVRDSMTKYSDAWYEVTGTINSLKAEVTAEVEESYASIIDAANDYVEKQTALDKMSEREQLAYWKQIQKSVKKGTDAWYDAQNKINSIQSSIGTVSTMSDLLDSYQTYTEISAQAEVQYWDIVRKQYAEGTDERLEADKNYYSAKKSYTEKLESLEDEYLSKVQSVNDQLESDIKALTDAYDDAISSRTATLKNAYSLFDEFTSESVTGEQLLMNIEGQAAGYEAWSTAMDELAARGILSDELLEDLTDMGPEEIAAIYALSDLTDEDLKKYNDAYQRKMDAIQAQAEKENEDLLAETEAQTEALKEQAEKDLADLKATYDSDVASVNETISSELKLLAQNTLSIADDETAAIVNAINGGMSSLETYFKNAEKAASAAATSATKTASSASTSTSSTSSSSSKSSSDEISKILDIILSGTTKTSLTAKQRASKSDLYVYLVDNYERALSTSKQKKLAKQLGVDTSKSGWRKKTLQALNKKGFEQGGEVNDDLIWMDELLNDIGPELVISRSDNALLTRLPRGSEIVDANTSQNLLRLSKVDPDELFATIAQQQAAADEYLNQVNALGMAKLNDLVSTKVNTQPIRISTSGMEERMDDIENLIGECIDLLTEGHDLYLDGDKLVGGTAEKMGIALAKRVNRAR